MTKEQKQSMAGWYEAEPSTDWSILRRMAWVTASLGTLEKDTDVSVGRGGRFKALSHDALVAHLNPLLARAAIYAQPIVGHCSEEQIRGSNDDAINKATAEVGYRFWNIDAPAPPVALDSEGPSRSWIEGVDFIDVHPVLVTAYDRSDKATGKAISYGKKYALRLAFNVATGEDVDDQSNLQPGSGPRRRSDRGPSNGYQQQRGDLPLPVLSVEPHPLAMDIPESCWSHVASVWDISSKPVSEPQRKRLYARAKSERGWTSDQVKAVVQHHLGVEVAAVPMRNAYDAIVTIFEDHEPSIDDSGGA